MDFAVSDSTAGILMGLRGYTLEKWISLLALLGDGAD